MANTLKDAQHQARARLSITGQAATARKDAELLLLHVTELSRAELLTHPDKPLSNAQLEAYFQAVERRANAEPIQYIIGTQEFYGLRFKVSPAVLIPRPETEHLVEAAVHAAIEAASNLARNRVLRNPLRILDVGTGSGAIAVSLAYHLSAAHIEVQIVATDISSAALDVARRNAESNGVGSRIRFSHCDLFPEDAGLFDIICSNPPYIADGEILEAQVAKFEPHTALFAGPTGLEIYERLIPQASAALRPGGLLLLEIGYGQQAKIESLLRASHLASIHFVNDLQTIPRVAAAYRPA
jgi:release factor glutamine methyltransferase